MLSSHIAAHYSQNFLYCWHLFKPFISQTASTGFYDVNKQFVKLLLCVEIHFLTENCTLLLSLSCWLKPLMLMLCFLNLINSGPLLIYTLVFLRASIYTNLRRNIGCKESKDLMFSFQFNVKFPMLFQRCKLLIRFLINRANMSTIFVF